MQSTVTQLALCCLAALLSSCSMFGAGSHVYCKTVTVACPSDSVIQRLTKLKASARFNDARSFPDGLGGETWVLHNFFFYDPEHQFLVRLEVPLHTPKNTELHLAGVEDFTSGAEWVGFTDMQAEKQKVVLAWFDHIIRPNLACKSSPNL